MAFLASLLVALAFMLPFILRRGGVLYITHDQITQLIPFTQHIVKSLHGGQWLYDFTLDLGGGMIEGYTWYNLASVFNLPLLLVPAKWVPYCIGPLLALKFACSGLFAYLYLRLFTHTDTGALVGSLLYTFSGVAISNMVFPFEDAYALFPLLLYGLERAVQNKGRGVLALGVALCALASPPFFLATVLFVAVYFVVRLLYRDIRLNRILFLRLVVECVIGVLLSACIVLPFVYSLLGNPRLESALPLYRWFWYNAYTYFEILRSLVFPPEVLHANSMLLLVDATSPELYLPMFGLVPVFALLLSRKKHWAKGVLLASFVMLCVPVLNAAFNGLNATFYTRWLYMPLLVGALATVLWLEDGALSPKRGYLVYGGVLVAYFGCCMLWKYYYGYGYVISYLPLFLLHVLLLIAGLVCTGLAHRLWRQWPGLLAGMVAVFCVALGGVNILISQTVTTTAYGSFESIADRTIYAAEKTPLPQGEYRIYIDSDMPVASQYFGYGSPYSFITTVPGSVFELQRAFGRQRTSISHIAYEEAGLFALLGVEYILADEGKAPALEGLVLYSEEGPYTVYHNPDALPLVMGFTTALLQKDVDGLDNSAKSTALLHGLVLDEEAAESLAGLVVLPAPQAESYETGVAARTALAADRVQTGDARVEASLTMAQEGALLITLPYDEGWQAVVNGQPADVVKVDWGLMAVACPAGKVELTMTYRPRGGNAGLGISAVGVVALCVWIVFGRKARQGQRHNK